MVRVRQPPHPPPPPSPPSYSPSISTATPIAGLSFLDSPARPSKPTPPSTFHCALKTIPATPHTTPFSCPLLTSGALTAEHFSHLACSFFPSQGNSPRDVVPAPTLLELKKHAQSLCLLISTLECSDLDNEKGNGLPPLGKGAFDFLDDPYVPYENDRPFCNQPLTSLVNTMPSQHIPSTAESLPECRILDNAEGTGDVEDLVGHVNECLEEIDHAFSPRGGLLALLPPETMDVKGDSEKNVFGQWLHYTQTLVRRVAELERDVVLLREILGSGEMVVPGVIAIDPKAGCGLGERAGRVVVAQDRYVLAGLNERLWDALDEELDLTESISCGRNERAVEFGVAERKRGGDMKGVQGRSGMELGGVRDVVAWVEVTSRVFRVMGQNRVFIIPAWDLKPSADAVRRIEETPLVQNIYTRTPGPEGNITPKQRSLKRKFEKVEAVEKENEALKKSLQYEKDSLRRWEAEWERERGEYQGRIETQEMVLGEVGWGTRRAGEKGGSGMGEGKGEGVEKGEGKEGEQGNGKGKGEEMGAGKDNGKGKEPEKETGNDGRKVGGDDGGKDGGSDGGDDGSDDGSGGRKGKGKGKGAKNAKKKKQTRAEKKAEEGKAQAKADDDAFRQGRKIRKVAFMAECHRKCKARFAEAEKAAWADEYKRRGEKEYAKKQRGGPALKGKEKASAKDGQLKRAGMGEMWRRQGERTWEDNEKSREKDSDESNEDGEEVEEVEEVDEGEEAVDAEDAEEDDGDDDDSAEGEVSNGRTQSL